MVAKGFLAATAIIICCSTTLQGKDPEKKCASGDCPATCSDKQPCSAESKCSAEAKRDEKEECCEKEQVSLEKCTAGECTKEKCSTEQCNAEQCSTEKCSSAKCSTGDCAKSKCSKEKCSKEKCSTDKCSAEKCTAGKSGGKQCAFTTTLGGLCGPLKCALEATPVSIGVTVETCSKSAYSAAPCATAQGAASMKANVACNAGACEGESCPVAACATQVCDALKCAVQSCTTSECTTGECVTGQCADSNDGTCSWFCIDQDCPAGQCNGAPCKVAGRSGQKCGVNARLTATGGELTFTMAEWFPGTPVAEKCSQEICTEGTCSSAKFGAEKCATSTCSTSKCASAKCSIETCSEKTCTAGECSVGKCGKTACAATECTPGVSKLETKLAQLEQLQRDIVELRRTTGAPEQMIVKVTVVEVNRTMCRNKGFDFETSSATGRGDLASQIQRFPALIEALERNNLARIVANPTLAVSSGRPVKFHAGGKALVTDANGNTAEREVGTKVDVLARSIGGNKVRVEIRPEFSQANHALSTIESHSVDAAFETTLGTPFVLSDACMSRVKAVTREVEGELRTKEEVEEIQRLTVVTVEGIGTPIERPSINQASYEDSLLEQAKQPEFATKVYPVPDLQVWKVRPQGVQFDADLLIAHIKSTIDAQSWRGFVYAGPQQAKRANGAIQPFERNGSLVICQTEENHQQIANLLTKMRVDAQEKDAVREERELRDGGVTPASAEEPVEQEAKCDKGACSKLKCTGSKCNKSEVSATTEAADQCTGECPETASCPCIGGECTR